LNAPMEVVPTRKLMKGYIMSWIHGSY